mgnify:CR=1 FL=1|tara:strand:- start:1980 stop:2867 length:888 start_codon:yes stop_codon:yes gene_type:complete
MANTIAGVNLAKVAMESLPALTDMFAPLSALSTDFSADISQSGESITTRIPTNVTAGDMTTGYQTNASDVVMVAKTVTLNQFKGFTYGFNDLERSKSEIDLNRLFIEPAMEAVGESVFNYVWALVTAANFASTEVITAANFDRDDLADFNAKLTVAKALKSGRSVFCNPSYYASLVKTLNSAEIPGITADKAGAIVPRVANFDTYETTLAGANGESLAAFAFQKSALIMAARTVLADEMTAKAGVDVETIVIPGLGLPIQFRKWYDPDGTLYFNMNVLFGASVGVGTAGHRITSA